MRIRLAIPDRLVTPEALEAALEATTIANEEAIARGEVPSLTDAIRRGVRWKPEPFTDGEHFDLAHQVTERQWGDCDDLGPWLAGELRASGDDPDARPRVMKTGPNRWHVVVETSDGEILDPSRWAGMGKRSSPTPRGVSGHLAQPTTRAGTGALAVMPYQGRWWGRVDLPWPDAAGHVASHYRAHTPERALMGALDGAIDCGEAIDSHLTDRAIACGEFLLSGCDEFADAIPAMQHIGAKYNLFKPQTIAAEIFAIKELEKTDPVAAAARLDQLKRDLPQSGLNLGKIFKGAVKAASSFIPGGSMIADTALSALSQGGGGGSKIPPGAIRHPSGAVSIPLESETPDHGQHMFVSYHPWGNPGPVIMRF